MAETPRQPRQTLPEMTRAQTTPVQTAPRQHAERPPPQPAPMPQQQRRRPQKLTQPLHAQLIWRQRPSSRCEAALAQQKRAHRRPLPRQLRQYARLPLLSLPTLPWRPPLTPPPLAAPRPPLQARRTLPAAAASPPPPPLQLPPTEPPEPQLPPTEPQLPPQHDAPAQPPAQTQRGAPPQRRPTPQRCANWRKQPQGEATPYDQLPRRASNAPRTDTRRRALPAAPSPYETAPRALAPLLPRASQAGPPLAAVPLPELLRAASAPPSLAPPIVSPRPPHVWLARARARPVRPLGLLLRHPS